MDDIELANYNYSDINSSNHDAGPSLRTRLIFASAWALIAIAGLIGNSLVIYVAIRYEKFSNVTNCFIVNLATTDIVFLVFCMPLLVIQYTLDHWDFHEIFCKLLSFTSFVSVLVTVLTLVVMTIDRYIYVVHPFENIRWRIPRTVFILSVIIWLLSCTLAAPSYFHYGIIVDDDGHKQCVLLADEHSQKQFRIYTVTLYYFIPLTIILICYAKLLYYVFAKEHRFRSRSQSNPANWGKRRRAVTKMVAVVTLVFSLCWLPTTLYIILVSFFEYKSALLYYFKVFGHSFTYLNSAINPILYAFLNRSFRNNCENIFSRPSCIPSSCKGDKSLQEKHSKRLDSNQQPRENFSTMENNITKNNNLHIVSSNAIDNEFSEMEDERIVVKNFPYKVIDQKMEYSENDENMPQTRIIYSKINQRDGHHTTAL